MEWEELDELHYRTPILGGWLLKAFSAGLTIFTPVGICFIPDPDHKWDGKSIDLRKHDDMVDAIAYAARGIK